MVGAGDLEAPFPFEHVSAPGSFDTVDGAATAGDLVAVVAN